LPYLGANAIASNDYEGVRYGPSIEEEERERI
jgi:hypothetical protein